MDDLISRRQAIDLIENESRKWGDEYGVSDVLCDLADLPSAQAAVDGVEVVRCKDCKHGRLYKWTDKYVECKMDVEPIDRDSNFFCADGERRSE